MANTAGVCGDDKGHWSHCLFPTWAVIAAEQIPLDAEVCQNGGSVNAGKMLSMSFYAVIPVFVYVFYSVSEASFFHFGTFPERAVFINM